MANPILPIQSGNNLLNLDADEDLHKKEQQDSELDAYAEMLDKLLRMLKREHPQEYINIMVQLISILSRQRT